MGFYNFIPFTSIVIFPTSPTSFFLKKVDCLLWKSQILFTQNVILLLIMGIMKIFSIMDKPCLIADWLTLSTWAAEGHKTLGSMVTLRLYKPQLDHGSAVLNPSVFREESVVFGAIEYWRQIRERISRTLRPEKMVWIKVKIWHKWPYLYNRTRSWTRRADLRLPGGGGREWDGQGVWAR